MSSPYHRTWSRWPNRRARSSGDADGSSSVATPLAERHLEQRARPPWLSTRAISRIAAAVVGHVLEDVVEDQQVDRGLAQRQPR